MRPSCAVAAGCLGLFLLAGAESVTHAALLYSNGPFVTGTGTGFGGADVSANQAPSITFGYNVNSPAFRLADNFVVPASSLGWGIESFTFYAYQTGSTTTSSFNGAFLRLWDGPPGAGGNVIVPLSGNLLDSTSWTGAYRVTATTLTDANRPIMQITADVAGWAGFPAVLNPGSYWIEWGLTGSLASGPFTPPTTPAGMMDNGRQLDVGTGAWTQVLDVPLGQGHDFPFQIAGGAVPEPTSLALLGLGAGLAAAGVLAKRRRRVTPR